MNCKDARKEFLTLLGGALALTERAPLEIHLDECPRCCWELERLQRKSALPRAIWRAGLALGTLDMLEAVAPSRTISRLLPRALSRVPSRVVLVAATVALMVVLATYGVQRRSELGTALNPGSPEASPVRQEPPRPMTPVAPLASSEAPSISPQPETSAPASARTEIPSARARQGAIPGQRAAATAPVRPSAGAAMPRIQAGPSATWVMGHTRDEQIVPETTAVRQDRD